MDAIEQAARRIGELGAQNSALKHEVQRLRAELEAASAPRPATVAHLTLMRHADLIIGYDVDDDGEISEWGAWAGSIEITERIAIGADMVPPDDICAAIYEHIEAAVRRAEQDSADDDLMGDIGGMPMPSHYLDELDARVPA